MTRAEAQGSRFLLLIAPQVLVSGAAMLLFSSAFAFPAEVWRLHVVTVGAVQCVFFLGWGLLSRSERVYRNPGTRYAYATALFAKAVALNLLYLGSYATRSAWGDNLSPANLRVLAPHLQGFRLAFGVWVYVVTGGVLLALAGAYVVGLGRAQSRLLRLRRAFPPTGPWWPQVVFTALVSVLVLVWWRNESDLGMLVRLDPIFSFCANQGQLDAQVVGDLTEHRDYPKNPVFRRKHVIVITVDCLRSDHLALYGYARETAPFLSSLGKAGHLQQVPVGFAVGNESQQGIFAVLGSHQVRRQDPRNFKLYDVLKRLGYRTTLIAAGDHSTFGSMHALYGPNFDVFSDGLDPCSYSVNDDRGLLEKLERVPAAGAQPSFFYFHLMSLHVLGVRDPRFNKWLPASAPSGDGTLAPTAATRSVATYDNAILQADSILSRMFAILERKGYLQDYVGVITGDHGEGLGERRQWGHTRFLYGKDIGVPILFLGSEPPPAVAANTRVAAQTDIAPTLLARLGLPIPGSWEGYPFGTAPPRRDIFLQGKIFPHMRGVVRVDGPRLYKYLFLRNRIGQPPEMLFDLAADPEETQNLIACPPPGLLDDLRHAAARYFDLSATHPSS